MNSIETPKADLYIVYDKSTKQQALSLSHNLTSKNYKCSAWKEKNYKDSENSLTNINRVLFFSQTLIEENISLDMAEKRELCKGATLVSIGNMHGIIVDPSVEVEKNFVGRNWWKYLITLVATGLIGSAILTVFLLVKDPIKKAKIKLYFEAVKYLIDEDHIKLIVSD